MKTLPHPQTRKALRRTPQIDIGRRAVRVNRAGFALLGGEGERFIAVVRREDGSTALHPIDLAGIVGVCRLNDYGAKAGPPKLTAGPLRLVHTGKYELIWDDDAQQAELRMIEVKR